jgi:hypothetical protein
MNNIKNTEQIAMAQRQQVGVKQQGISAGNLQRWNVHGPGPFLPFPAEFHLYYRA